MSTITAVLIDDETSNLQGLQRKIEQFFPAIDILKTFQVPEEGLEFLRQPPPDLLFLDIQMPRMNGFELLTRLSNVSFEVIFVTAYNEFALKALKQSAVDYVLKPIDNDDLKYAIEKALRIIEDKAQQESKDRLLHFLTQTLEDKQKLIVPTSSGLSFVAQNEVLHLEGDEGYTRIHLKERDFLSSYSLGKFEKLLAPHFFKCHKSHIVNLNNVESFENEGYLVLTNGRRVPISKTYRKTFINLFER